VDVEEAGVHLGERRQAIEQQQLDAEERGDASEQHASVRELAVTARSPADVD